MAASAATAVTMYYISHRNLGRKKDEESSSVVVTTLTEPRGSAALGLPSSLSPKTIEIIKATAGVVAPKVRIDLSCLQQQHNSSAAICLCMV